MGEVERKRRHFTKHEISSERKGGGGKAVNLCLNPEDLIIGRTTALGQVEVDLFLLSTLLPPCISFGSLHQRETPAWIQEAALLNEQDNPAKEESFPTRCSPGDSDVLTRLRCLGGGRVVAQRSIFLLFRA